MIETDNKLKGKINSSSSIKGSGISVKGETGNGIEKIEKTNTEGLIDTYTIYYTDGTTSIFQVSNGGKGDKGDKPIKGVDYFTPAEVQDIQNNILDNVNQFSVEVVETLPIQNIKDHTIYFVPKTTAEQNDIYDEYIYINNSWEHIGTTEVDLSNYYNKTEVDTKVTNIENAISESGVIVSATEPTGANREKIWVQNGKNLLNKNVGFTNTYISNTGEILTANNNALFNGYISIKSNTIYTISTNTNISFAFSFYDKNYNFIERDIGTSIKAFSYTSPSNAVYMRIHINMANIIITQTIIDGLDIMLEQNAIATTYEPYVEPKMYVLNDNNVYEEFIQKEKIEKVTQNLTLNTTYANGGTVNYIKSNNIVQAYIRLDLKAVSTAASYINIASGLLFKPSIELKIYANLLSNNEVLSSNEALVQIRTNGDIYLKTTASYANNSLVIITFTYITED